MKIINRLILLSIAFAVMIVAIGLITSVTFSLVKKELKDSHDANILVKDVFELNAVTYQYTMHHEKRMQQQWQIKYDSFGKLLARMTKGESHPECQTILANIIPEYKALGDLFSQLQANITKRKSLIKENRPEIEINMTLVLEERLVTQTAIRAQKIVSGAFELSDIMQKRITRLQQKTNLVVLFSIIGFIVLSICISFLTIRSITTPITMLVEGTEIIGAGNLEYKIGTKTKDEIGQLSRAFERMIENLKKTTASRDELEREIAERNKLVNELQEALKEIKTLRGILPLCSFCKKIRDDKGYWEQVDVYIHKHSQADISHSVCPECAKEHYPDFVKE